MNTIQIPGICDPEATIEPKKQEKRFKLCVDLLDGSITIVPIEQIDSQFYTEIQPISESEVMSLGKPVNDKDYDDNFDIHCDKCNKFYRPYCRLHPLFKIPDRPPTDTEGKPYAWRTLPVLFMIAESKLPGAGLGVFAQAFIPIGMVFGPYKGVKCLSETEFFKDGYAWEIKGKDRLLWVDGSNPEKSNWLRYINSPRHEAEQNMLAFQVNGRVFYRVIKPIRINDEVLVWYGANFGGEFSITTIEKATKKNAKNPFIWKTKFKVAERIKRSP